MATDGPVNITPSERPVGNSPVDGFVWQPDSLNMHVIRPKSAKGRTRPSLHQPQGFHHTPSSPPSALPCELPSSQKSGACAPRSPHQGAPDEIPELLQLAPVGASSSLNKYPVLPSINRKTLEEGAVDTVAKKAGSLQLSSVQALYREDTCTMKTSEEDSRPQACSLERKLIVRTKRQSSSRPGDLEEPSDREPRLLLAVRSPSGRRFVRHFRPTDDLQTVVAVAEYKNKTTYQHCSIETMEVPRRCFSDLSKSLQECRIPHKSVLGISQQDGEGWP
ncbi:UBX domain-containing protein 10 [Talpa occidentalis]|uniref:UBX domain-containing protein 10 n=1 Tax=Talpa occidentalis TaxID=50954 RepID=UPI00188E8A3A|nr:UBX domain-containing protein 10 [Talpa occidentalis]XP_037355014.1 UBX domain-containing protein 10 [Talpa occidentalis]XP_054547484.1 UBX domain-containing protein 10 [Talpa occidentalis]